MRIRFVAVFSAVAVAGACTEPAQPTQPTSFSIPLTVRSDVKPGTPENHRTHLTGDAEVPPRETLAQGQAIIQISKDGLSFDYKVIASNIENVVQAHIHCAPAGVNGPIVVWLFPSPISTQALDPIMNPEVLVRHDGVLAEGRIDSRVSAHVRPTTNAACPGGVANFAAVLDRIREGNAYVNVHTTDGVNPPNTGPGDFPGGEVRGQIR